MNTHTKLKGIGLAALKGSTELLMVLPLLLLAGVYLFPENVSLWLWLITLPVCYAAGFAINQLLNISKMFLMLGMVICVGAIDAISLSGSSYAFFIVLPVAAVCVYRGARMVTVLWSLMFPVSFYAVGLVIYFIGSVVLQFVPSFEPYLPFLTGFGLLALALTFLMTNQTMMKQETLSGNKEPVLASGVLLQNRVLIILVLVLIVLIVYIRKLQAALLWLKDQIIAWLNQLLNHSSEPPPANQEVTPPPSMNLGETPPPAAWLQWLEKVMMFLVGAALVIGVLILLYFAAKRLPPLIKRLFQWLMLRFNQRGLHQQDTGYEDDIENLMDWKGLNSSLTGSLRQWLKGQFHSKGSWSSMDNRERARFLYREWLRKHTKEGYKLQKHLTPEEISQDIQRWRKREPSSSLGPIVGIYEQARYSDKTLQEADIEVMKKFVETK
ncbi:protein of unknown function [Paenibacillus sp. 1_12]|uniref:DUF4129 domain-containing protein n=1 Tax=Paenibacillus sp. 1_12 TaxID=1566278 RepID=UPI0008F15120|nr:DUF4129 domain-containing protein [Paenibacillus sp. 1_12]SFL80186.1 protein of unknown function [Paenibacillus sp. 1_12]